MKNKYQRMNKEEKQKCKEKYYKTEKGKEMKVRFIRLNIIGIVGIFFSIFLIINGYIENSINIWTWIWASILFICSMIFIIGSSILKGKVLNNFAVKKL